MCARFIVGLGMAMALSATHPAWAEDTFSICAVDLATGEVGSAGASCISGSIIISDVHPGVGVIHTQSYWNAQNQAYARGLMDDGHSPDEIIALLEDNDAQGNPAIRQYGVVDVFSGGRSAAYTGSSCISYANHTLGQTYAIQGNILLGASIIADMETAFLTTGGTLADRMMAALQGANVPGADTRCLDAGKPAISAFIRVARPGDVSGDFHLDLNVNNTSPSQNPIDLLQGLYDDWTGTVSVPPAETSHTTLLPARPNPVRASTRLGYVLDRACPVRVSVYDVAGREVVRLADGPQPAGVHELRWTLDASLPAGVYHVRLETPARSVTRRLIATR